MPNLPIGQLPGILPSIDRDKWDKERCKVLGTHYRNMTLEQKQNEDKLYAMETRRNYSSSYGSSSCDGGHGLNIFRWI